jgi:hypothetical protein
MMATFFHVNSLSGKRCLSVTQSLFAVVLLCAGKTAGAEEWYSLAEDPHGNTMK